MKLTWFGGSTVRVHIGGAIVVLDVGAVRNGVDVTELVAGADIVLDPGDAPVADGLAWRPRRTVRLVDDDAPAPVLCWTLGADALLVEAVGEAPLVVVYDGFPALGRWSTDAVILLCGNLIANGRLALRDVAPRLLALSGDEAEIEATIAVLRDELDGTGLVALEPGLALEV